MAAWETNEYQQWSLPDELHWVPHRLCPVSTCPSHDHLFWLLCSVLRAAACFGLDALHWVALLRKVLYATQTWRIQLCRPAPRPRSTQRGLYPAGVVLTRPAAGPRTRRDSRPLSLGILARTTSWGLRSAVPVPPKRSLGRPR